MNKHPLEIPHQKPSLLFGIDYRNLALIRIFLGIFCVFDILRRLPYVDLLYSNQGLLSNHFALFSGTYPRFSLLYSFNSPAEVYFFFTLVIVSASLFAVGMYTKVVSLTTLVGMVSIINRNWMTIYGGDTIIINLLFLCVLLPVGRAWSVDAYRKGSSASGTYTSFAVALIYLQIAVVYFFASVHKTGETWNSGLGLYYSLYQDRVVTVFGEFLRVNAPLPILKLASNLSLYIEFAAPFLILSPISTAQCRRIAFYLLVGFHIGILSCLNLGMFEYVMIGLLTSLLPVKELDWIGRRFFNRVPASPTHSKIPLTGRVIFFEVLSIALGYIFFTHLIVGNGALRTLFKPTTPALVTSFVEYTSYRQSWSMYAPDAPLHDHYLVFETELTDGSRIDALTGKPVQLKALERQDQWWDQQIDSVQRLFHPYYGIGTSEILRWIETRRGGMQIPAEQGIKSLSIKDLIDRSPTPEERVHGSSFDFSIQEKLRFNAQ